MRWLVMHFCTFDRTIEKEYNWRVEQISWEKKKNKQNNVHVVMLVSIIFNMLTKTIFS